MEICVVTQDACVVLQYGYVVLHDLLAVSKHLLCRERHSFRRSGPMSRYRMSQLSEEIGINSSSLVSATQICFYQILSMVWRFETSAIAGCDPVLALLCRFFYDVYSQLVSNLSCPVPLDQYPARVGARADLAAAQLKLIIG